MLVKLDFLTVRGEHRLRVFEDVVLRDVFGPKRREYQVGEGCIMMGTVISTHQMLG